MGDLKKYNLWRWQHVEGLCGSGHALWGGGGGATAQLPFPSVIVLAGEGTRGGEGRRV